jgi:DNA polymerase-3 subunit beta
MNIQINRKVLADALTEVAPFAGKSKMLAIYNNIKFVTKGNRIRLQTTDLENTIRKYVTAESIDEDREFLVDCRAFTDFVKSLKDETITLKIESNTITIIHAKGNADLPITPTDGFTEPITEDDSVNISVPSDMLLEAIDNGKRFVSTDEIKAQMKGIHVKFENGNFVYEATDTRKMIRDEMSLSDAPQDVDWIISIASGSVIANSAKSGTMVDVKIGDKTVCYKFGDTMLFSQKIQGNFPNCARVIPHDNNIEVSADKVELVDAIKRTMLLCDDNTKLIKLTISRMDIIVEANNMEVGRKASESVIVESSGELVIGFAANLLLNVINCVGSNNVVMKFSNAGRPMLIVDENKPNKNIILMPMNLQA